MIPKYACFAGETSCSNKILLQYNFIMKHVNVGLIGFGTVGSGLAEVLLSQQERLQQRSGLTIRLAKVADISTKELPAQFADTALTNDAAELINDPNIDIIVELIGGIQPAKTFVLEAIATGKHVVTANKALLSLEGKEILPLRRPRGSRSALRPVWAVVSR